MKGCSCFAALFSSMWLSACKALFSCGGSFTDLDGIFQTAKRVFQFSFPLRNASFLRKSANLYWVFKLRFTQAVWTLHAGFTPRVWWCKVSKLGVTTYGWDMYTWDPAADLGTFGLTCPCVICYTLCVTGALRALRAPLMWRCWTWALRPQGWTPPCVLPSGWESPKATKCLLWTTASRVSTKARWETRATLSYRSVGCWRWKTL